MSSFTASVRRGTSEFDKELGALVPARRAASIEPMQALRTE